MSFEGMDVGAIRSVAHQIGAQATTLGSLITSIDHLAGEALHSWDGHDAHEFHGRWTSQHRPSFQVLHHQLLERQRDLERQAAQQEEASGAAGGGASAGGRDGVGARATAEAAWSWVTAGNDPYGAAATTIAGTAYLATHRLVGSYPKGWNHLSPLFRVKRSPVLHAAQSALQHIPGATTRLPKMSDALGRLGPLSTAIGVADLGVQGTKAAEELWSGNVHDGVYDGATAAASGLKASKNPVAYLGGVIVQEGVEIGKAAEQTDWSSEGVAMVTAEIGRDPLGALAAGAQADADWMRTGLVRIFG